MTATSDIMSSTSAGGTKEDSELAPEVLWALLVGERKSRGLRAKDMAMLLGVVPAAVSKLENGPVPMLVTIRRYANALGFDVTLGLRRRPAGPYQVVKEKDPNKGQSYV